MRAILRIPIEPTPKVSLPLPEGAHILRVAVFGRSPYLIVYATDQDAPKVAREFRVFVVPKAIGQGERVSFVGYLGGFDLDGLSFEIFEVQPALEPLPVGAN